MNDKHGDGAHEMAGHGGHHRPDGLLVSQHGYTLQLDQTILSGGTTTVRFQVIGPDGKTVSDFERTHDKDLHFIAVRRDTTGFQHVHPTMDAAGIWTTELRLTAGVWRFFADFHPAGHEQTMTLGIDASVGGHYDPQPLPEPSTSAHIGEYAITLTGQLTAGDPSELTLNVSRGAQPVTDLQPYLSAYGHLVALRTGDLAYLHVHPEGEPGDGTTRPGPDIGFIAVAPSAGTYRLFLDFRHDGEVHTAEFTANAVRCGHI